MRRLVSGLAMSLMMTASLAAAQEAAVFDLQGHRGARGLRPENTLAAFAEALSIGVTTLELDIGISRDGIAVVSHNRRLSPELTRNAAGDWLSQDGPTLSSLNLAEIAAFDVGRIDPASRYASRFSDQVSVDGSRMPTLEAVFDLVARSGNQDVRFNIETKTSPLEDEFTWPPVVFVETILEVVRAAGLMSRITIQSFDWRTLQIVQDRAPEIITSYLTAQQRWLNNIEAGKAGPSPWTAGFDIDDFDGNVAALVAAAGGKIWSSYHLEVDAARIKDAHDRGLVVKVWTVNDADRMNQLIDMGVDGIITDYPDRLRAVMAARGMVLPTPTPVD